MSLCFKSFGDLVRPPFFTPVLSSMALYSCLTASSAALRSFSRCSSTVLWCSGKPVGGVESDDRDAPAWNDLVGCTIDPRGRETARMRCWLAKRALWRAIERMGNITVRTVVDELKRDSIIEDMSTSIHSRSPTSAFGKSLRRHVRLARDRLCAKGPV